MNIEQIAGAIVGILGAGAILVLYAAIVSWAIRDANQRGKTGCFIFVLFWLFGPLSILIWLIIRPTVLTQRQPESYSNPDDAMAAASGMDMQGDWDAAIGLYEYVAHRWPEHQPYAAACIQKIKEKQSLT